MNRDLALRVGFVLLVAAAAIVAVVRPVNGDDIKEYDYINFLFREVNNLRAENGLPPFAYNPKLQAAAFEQAKWMIANSSYAHFHGGSRPSTRAKSAGYEGALWCCGENTYLSVDRTPEASLRFWIKSYAHYTQLLNPTLTEMGVGYAHGELYTGQVIVFANNPNVGASQPPPPFDVIQDDPPIANKQAPTASAAPTAQETQDGCTSVHVVKFGDTLFHISQIYGVSMEAIAARNGISNYEMIAIEDRLCIEGGRQVYVASTTNQTQFVVSTAKRTSNSATPLDNWCQPGGPWGDGRCIIPDNKPAQDHMWRCGWYLARDLQVEGC